MAKRILVPLDEATEHEAVLPLVADAARASGATVRLLHVAPPSDNVVNDDGLIVAFADQEASRQRGFWLDYLATFDTMLQDVEVERSVRFGRPTDEILTEAEEFGADLIAVATARRNSLTRGLLGSVAEQLMKRARVPVLLLRPALG
jgi:nucleotide-binding universal stress UspA family protein